MGNMGFSDLYLVRPVDHLVEEARVRSSGNESILAQATVCDRFSEAIGDSTFVVGTSARIRTVGWPTLSPREAMREIAKRTRSEQQCAIVFGPERTGLENRHIDQCNVLIRIPVDDKAPSINLAGAVLIVLYELRLMLNEGSDGSPKPTSREKNEIVATNDQIEGFFAHLQNTMESTGFIAESPRDVLMRKIRRIFLRPGLTVDEVNILRGILTAVGNNNQTNHPSKQ